MQKSSIATFPWNGTDAVGLNATHNTSSNNSDTHRNTTTNNNNNTTNNHIVTSPLSSGTGNGTELNSPSSVTLATTSSSAIASAGGTTMPVGGVQSQNHTQGLVHWMSAVMAEHMTSNSHHDPTVGMHYMWNGSVDVSIYWFVCSFLFVVHALYLCSVVIVDAVVVVIGIFVVADVGEEKKTFCPLARMMRTRKYRNGITKFLVSWVMLSCI